MTRTVHELYQELEPDQRTYFSADMELVHRSLFRSINDKTLVIKELNEWLKQFQPCLFGRIAAKQELLRWCILTEDLLTASDANIRSAIQDARLNWHADAFEGRASGFIVAAVSERLAHAMPDQKLADLAKRICELYLLEEVPFDTACTDTIYLAKPGRAQRVWKWAVGVNFFGSQGDGSWWHDHRFPGGIAFSMNSVGHMAKSGAINLAMRALDQAVDDAGSEDWINSHVQSLEKAVALAMRTIKVASEGNLPGTHLFASAERSPQLACPFALPPDVAAYNHCEYFGYYHTDHTLPSDYFRGTRERPSDAPSFENLDFSYLFDRASDDFMTMGEGLRIRGVDGEIESSTEKTWKREKAIPADSTLADEPLLREALAHAERSRDS